jgi:hypothetical protein
MYSFKPSRLLTKTSWQLTEAKPIIAIYHTYNMPATPKSHQHNTKTNHNNRSFVLLSPKNVKITTLLSSITTFTSPSQLQNLLFNTKIKSKPQSPSNQSQQANQKSNQHHQPKLSISIKIQHHSQQTN